MAFPFGQRGGAGGGGDKLRGFLSEVVQRGFSEPSTLALFSLAVKIPMGVSLFLQLLLNQGTCLGMNQP